MADDRLDQVYEMVTSLIHMVGHTNAVVEELRVGQDELRGDVSELCTGQDEIKNHVVRIEQKVDKLAEYQAGIFELLGEHDIIIRTLQKEKRTLRQTSPP